MKRLFDVLTTHSVEYYLFDAEEKILREKGDEIVSAMHRYSGSVPRNELIAPVSYFALDLHERELQRTLGSMVDSDAGKDLEGKIELRGLCPTYEEGLNFAAASDALITFPKPHNSGGATDLAAPMHLIFPRSTLGNLSRDDSVCFLKALPLRPGLNDTLLVGMEHDNEKDVIEAAYKDAGGYMRQVQMNGLKGAGRALGDENMFDETHWKYGNVS
ncbi:hypothetical protein C8J57DRAFT_1067116 [Mycena rebaudengoi]|nr:hypothetical protein C8J57DRAFT_1067116 [Mycena rebaudengoi]